jgi:hypothetical protein
MLVDYLRCIATLVAATILLSVTSALSSHGDSHGETWPITVRKSTAG